MRPLVRKSGGGIVMLMAKGPGIIRSSLRTLPFKTLGAAEISPESGH